MNRLGAVSIFWAALRLSSVSSLAPSASPDRSGALGSGTHVVIVGKIILDSYGNPDARPDGDDRADVTIGGGGPQAAFGACCGLALAGRLAGGGGVGAVDFPSGGDDGAPPPRQAVAFVGPVGTANWSGGMTRDLSGLLPMLAVPPVLSESDAHMTPTIDIWHDEDESVRWRPRDGSFGESGAGGLWRERPRPADVLRAIEGLGGPDGGEGREVYLHSIVEAGRGSPGREGGDAAPFLDDDVVRRISGGGVEPVVFPDESGTVSREDGDSALDLVARIKASLDGAGRTGLPLVVSPDLACWEAFRSSGDFGLVEGAEYAIRNGPEGCITADGRAVPAATLTTDEVNPTGAGNAFSGAYFACRAAGRDVDESSIVAGAVGAVFCEHPHMPPWSWATLRRIAEAARDIEAKLGERQGDAVSNVSR